MRARRIARLLGVEPTPYDAPYFKFDEHAYLILSTSKPGTGRGGTGVWFPPGRLVTLNDPDGNIIGLIDNSKVGMPGQR
ncbi:MAG: hypothetical protein E6K82_13040 [Candidatus Rokuibacteriota bacterium]|nr:MAG: hypothetical protein E6K82_13040 [Candidatus Rokubacteria bacterium]